MTSEKLMDLILKAVKPGKAYFCWTGEVNYEEGHERIHAGHLYLNILHPAITARKEKVMRYKRFSGRQVREKGLEPYMEWTSSGLLKITSGPRCGKITTVWGLNDNESFVQVSIDKVFKKGKRRSHFDFEKPLDIEILDTCERMLSVGIRETDIDNMEPRLHLAVSKKDRLFLRKSSYALNKLRKIVRADSDMSIDDMLEELVEHHGIDSGNNNLAFPYDTVYGAGTVVSDIYRQDNGMQLGSWCEIDAESCSLDCREMGIFIDSQSVEKNARKVSANA